MLGISSRGQGLRFQEIRGDKPGCKIMTWGLINFQGEGGGGGEYSKRMGKCPPPCAPLINPRYCVSVCTDHMNFNFNFTTKLQLHTKDICNKPYLIYLKNFVWNCWYALHFQLYREYRILTVHIDNDLFWVHNNRWAITSWNGFIPPQQARGVHMHVTLVMFLKSMSVTQNNNMMQS